MIGKRLVQAFSLADLSHLLDQGLEFGLWRCVLLRILKEFLTWIL